MAGGKKKGKRAKVSGKSTSKADRVARKAEKEVRSGTAVAGVEHVPLVAESSPAVVTHDAIHAEPRGRLTEMVPVRFDARTLHAVKQRATDDNRSVSSWIRRAVDRELARPTS